MKLKFYSPIVDSYFFDWINKPTWVTFNMDDVERFYKFIKAYIRYSRKNYLLNKFRNNISLAANEIHGAYQSKEQINESIESYLNKAFIILEYERAKFPDHLVEMRDYYAVYTELSRRVMTDEKGQSWRYSDQEIQEILSHHFVMKPDEENSIDLYTK